MEPEDLAVIGHTGDLLVDIYARNLTHIYILPQCSTTAARVLNPAGMDAQFERLRCAISRGILSEAKSLYGLLLDKMGLSRKSGWFDQQGRTFVYYGINRIMEDLGCAHSKAEKLLSELEQAGLLRRKRQGLGKPSALYPLKFENRIS